MDRQGPSIATPNIGFFFLPCLSVKTMIGAALITTQPPEIQSTLEWGRPIISKRSPLSQCTSQIFIEEVFMLPGQYRWLLAVPTSEDIIGTYQITYEFHQEVKYRQAHQKHCEWYRATAAKHRQELEKMRRDINIFGWFYRAQN